MLLAFTLAQHPGIFGQRGHGIIWLYNLCCLQGALQHCRYQELEEALSLAEQHLSQHDKQTAVKDLEQQIQHLQMELSSQSARAEHLHQELQTAEAVKQQATDELAAFLKQQKAMQVCILVWICCAGYSHSGWITTTAKALVVKTTQVDALLPASHSELSDALLNGKAFVGLPSPCSKPHLSCAIHLHLHCHTSATCVTGSTGGKNSRPGVPAAARAASAKRDLATVPDSSPAAASD